MGKQRMKKALSVALSASMAIGALASVQPFPELRQDLQMIWW